MGTNPEKQFPSNPPTPQDLLGRLHRPQPGARRYGAGGMGLVSRPTAAVAKRPGPSIHFPRQIGSAGLSHRAALQTPVGHREHLPAAQEQAQGAQVRGQRAGGHAEPLALRMPRPQPAAAFREAPRQTGCPRDGVEAKGQAGRTRAQPALTAGVSNFINAALTRATQRTQRFIRWVRRRRYLEASRSEAVASLRELRLLTARKVPIPIRGGTARVGDSGRGPPKTARVHTLGTN